MKPYVCGGVGEQEVSNASDAWLKSEEAKGHAILIAGSKETGD